MVDAAVAAGADAIKLQTYTADELVALRGDGPAPAQWGEQGWTMRTLYENAATSRTILEAVVAKCTAQGIPWFSSVFGAESLAVLEGLGCPAYKIARLDAHHAELLSAVDATRKPVLVSMADAPTPYRANTEYLYCPPGYPARFEDVKLPVFDDFLANFDGHDATPSDFLGLSSHNLDPRLPIAAVARGAKLIEMHFQLAEEPSDLEANISLNQYQWRLMVDDVRATEVLCGL